MSCVSYQSDVNFSRYGHLKIIIIANISGRPSFVPSGPFRVKLEKIANIFGSGPSVASVPFGPFRVKLKTVPQTDERELYERETTRSHDNMAFRSKERTQKPSKYKAAQLAQRKRA